MKTRAWLALSGLLLAGCQLSAIGPLRAAADAVSGQVAEALVALRDRQPADATAYSFALVGDSRGGLDVLRREAAEIDRQNPEFVIYTGDLVGDGTEQEYRDGLAVLRTIRAPVFPAVGNHERNNGGIRWYFELFGKDLDYAFDHGNWRFVCLDNSTGGLNSAQLAWLQLQLQTPRRKVVFAHMPPPLGIWWVHPFRGNYKAFLSVVEAAKVDACLFGHIHIFDKAERKGIRHVVSGGGGAPLYRLPFFNSRAGGAFYHWVLAKTSDQGVAFEVRKLQEVKPELVDTTPEGEDPHEDVQDF